MCIHVSVYHINIVRDYTSYVSHHDTCNVCNGVSYAPHIVTVHSFQTFAKWAHPRQSCEHFLNKKINVLTKWHDAWCRPTRMWHVTKCCWTSRNKSRRLEVDLVKQVPSLGSILANEQKARPMRMYTAYVCYAGFRRLYFCRSWQIVTLVEQVC